MLLSRWFGEVELSCQEFHLCIAEVKVAAVNYSEGVAFEGCSGEDIDDGEGGGGHGRRSC